MVDDEESNLLAMQRILEAEAYQVAVAKQAAAALGLFHRGRYDLVLTDLRMPGATGLELLRSIRRENSSLPVLILTAHGTVEDAVEAMKLGAVDFLAKPIRRDQILRSVQDALARSRAATPRARPDFLGQSTQILQLKRSIRMLAKTNASVLIEGESGTGKEIVAQTIHAESGREGRLLSLNCGAIPESLLESELFGYEKGAFTGAVNAKNGLFEMADRGTLFLDEIGDMPPALQVKLLRVLQDGTFFRLGGTHARAAQVRVVAATNTDLKRRIAEGKFREDLYYRLNVVSLVLPPLRERPEDIPLLAEHFLEQAKEMHGKGEAFFSAEAKAAFLVHNWPGNVRELKNLVERTLVMLEGAEIKAADMGLRQQRQEPIGSPSVNPESRNEMRFVVGTSLRDMEVEAIRRTLELTGGDKAKAAELLGINQRTIYRRLAELGPTES